MNPHEIIAKIISHLNNDLKYSNLTETIIEDGCVKLPIFYSEDIDGKIKFDIESISNNFRDLIVELEEYNNLN
jgi:hypothetical protein